MEGWRLGGGGMGWEGRGWKEEEVTVSKRDRNKGCCERGS